MVTFVAFDQVEINHLIELGHLADTGPSEISGRTPTGFVVTQGNVKFFIGGNHLQYQQGFPAGGNVTSLLITVSGDNAYKFSNFSYTVSQAFDILSDPPEQAVQRILAGNDSITGSRFADTLFGYNGIDTVKGAAGNDFINGGNGNDKLFGDAGNDTIVGGAGADQLHGGIGKDILKGDVGADRFYFETGLNNNTNVDRVTFLAGDKLVLDLSIFGEIDGPKLKPIEFNVGVAAETLDHRIIYNPANGILQYDRDGLGGVAATKFAVLVGAPDDIDRLDFILVA